MESLDKKIYGTLTDAKPKASPENFVERHAPANFVRLLLARTLSKIGDRLSSPKTTLAWVLQALGAPPIFTGLIVPLRESGSLLPQILLSNYLKRYALRKWAWTLGAAVQGAAIAGCAWTALTLEGSTAGLSIVTLVAIFSLARGISSVSAKDVLGKTIPQSKRGQLTGWAGSISGVIAIASASFLFFSNQGEGSTGQYAAYLAAAALLWGIAAIVNARIIEPAGETEPPSHLMEGFGEQVHLLRDDSTFRNFLIVRALAVGSGLATPYIVSLAHTQLGGGAHWLAVFIMAEGLAAMLTAPLWGRWADRSSRTVLRNAMSMVAVLLVGLIVYVQFTSQAGSVVFPLALFLLGVAHTGVRVGRKTYVVDIAQGDKRTDYVAVGNTLIGLLLILAGLLTGLASLLAIEWALGILALCALTGSLYGRKLPSVRDATST